MSRPTSQCARQWTDTAQMPPAATSASPFSSDEETLRANTTAAAPASTPPASTALPNQTGKRLGTPRRNAFVSMRPICSP